MKSKFCFKKYVALTVELRIFFFSDEEVRGAIPRDVDACIGVFQGPLLFPSISML